MNWFDYINPFAAIRADLRSILSALQRLETKMATLDELLAAAEAEDTKIDSLIALTTEVKTKLDAALAGVLTPAQQAKVDEIFAAISDNPDRIQAAIDANTPADPAPTP